MMNLLQFLDSVPATRRKPWGSTMARISQRMVVTAIIAGIALHGLVDIPLAVGQLSAPREANGRRPVTKLLEFAHPMAICYGPYRDGQDPDGEQPSRAEILEDLRIIAESWKLLRFYGSSLFGETICEVIRTEKLPLKVMVGAWLDAEGPPPLQTAEQQKKADDNRREIEAAIRIANEYPDVVLAVTVGNETQVDWAFHPVDQDRLIQYLREVRQRTSVPISTADDCQYWISAASKPVADEIDFIVTHIYAMWHGQQLDDAIPFSKAKLAEVQQAHPDHVIVIGETGWATVKPTEGEQAVRLRGKAGIAEQQQFVRELAAWIKEDQVPVFLFQAFDENWKGGPDPLDAEKHWGIYGTDRQRKSTP